MKKKKKLLILFSSCVFVALMLFNVSVSMEDTGSSVDISLSGISALADCHQHENGCDGAGMPQCTGMMCVGNFSCYGIICSDICVFTGDPYGRCEMSYGFFVGCTQQACFIPFPP